MGLVGPVGHHFADIVRPTVGREGPQDVGKIFVAETRRLYQTVEADVDFGAALLRFDDRLTLGFGHQDSAAEIDHGGAIAILVVDGLDGALGHRNVINRRGSRLGRRGGSLLAKCSTGAENQNGGHSCGFHGVPSE